MYLDYWGFKEFPFENVADPDFFYMSEAHEEALTRLVYAAEMRKGGAMLSGDIGGCCPLVGGVKGGILRHISVAFRADISDMAMGDDILPAIGGLLFSVGVGLPCPIRENTVSLSSNLLMSSVIRVVGLSTRFSFSIG